MDHLRFCLSVPFTVWPVIGSSLLFACLLLFFWRSHAGTTSFYFDPGDFKEYEEGLGRELPVAAENGTFLPMLQNYTGVTKLLITVAAASIAFGANAAPRTGVIIAKIILALSILFGAVFAALLQFFYDEYTQNVRAYTRIRYSLVEALGFSCLTCFIAGYLVWAFNLG